MKSDKLKKHWRIWILPLVLWYAFVFLAEEALLSQHALVHGNATCDVVFSYSIGGALVATCWIIAQRYEKIEGKPVRRITRVYLKCFLVIYIASLILTLIFSFAHAR